MKSTAADRHVSAACVRLLQGCSMTSLAWLARGESSCRNYYVVSGAGSQCHASHPTWESLPWPVHLTLGTFSRRHIFRFPKQYDGRAARYAVSQLCRDDVGPRPDGTEM